MKKILLFFISALFLLTSVPLSTKAIAQDRAHILKVYNWADYLDLSLIEEFEAWYKEQTGEDVKVRYSTFDINENMLRNTSSNVCSSVACCRKSIPPALPEPTHPIG